MPAQSRHTVLLTAAAVLLMLAGTSAPGDARGAEARRVSVVGRATVEAAPDLATVRLAVVRTAPEVDAARDEVGDVAARFLALCAELNIDRADVDTTGMRVVPQYRRRRSAEDEPEVTGYRVSRDLTVTVRELGQVGPLIERALTLGVNQASPPSFGVSDEEALHRQALEQAARNARARARVLSETLGARLGPVREIDADDTGPRPMAAEVFARAAVSSSADNEATYDPGRVKIEATARVTFELLPAMADDAG